MQASHSIAARLVKKAVSVVVTLAAASAVYAAVPGISGETAAGVSSFDLVAAAGNITQPDGATIYSWGYGCATAPAGFVPTAISGSCPLGQMQLPGPTLVVHKGDTVTVTLHNNLPAAAGNTSILFPGFKVTTAGGSAGLLTQEACSSKQGASCTTSAASTVTYTFTADLEGTHSYYSGTQGDLQVEMGLYGALIVLPSTTTATNIKGCATSAVRDAQSIIRDPTPGALAPKNFRLADAAYDHASACYDREYLFQTSEMDPRIHQQALAQSQAPANLNCKLPTGCMSVETEPYHAAYFLLNGRSMPDDMDPNYAPQYPNQPYNSNPHMHPGEVTLVRIIGQGRMQHPFHEHANHVRVLARDGHLLLNAGKNLSGPLLFTTTTSPGQAIDALFEFTGKNLNWDVYGHGDGIAASGGDVDITNPATQCDANGYFTTKPSANNFYEWCADHKKALESKPFGNVGNGGPVTLPDPNILVNGAWYSGSPYLGPDATGRAAGATPIPPFGTIANDPGSEAGFAFMWHSHNEREITTNNIFPGGLMTMMLVDPWVYLIDETK
jgi:FtsP/CotA-like multicopper oxidase with cupredoxin domain